MSRILPSLFLLVACLFAPLGALASDPTLVGFGDSEAEPVGDRWELPPGVTVGPIRGHTLFFAEECSTDPEEVRGSGDLVMLCVPLTYVPPPGRPGVPPGLPIKVTIPAGLIFIADNISTQNGIVIKKFIVEIRPGETVYIPVGLKCVNVSRSGSSPSDTYRVGPITRNPGFQRFFALLENKRLPATAMGTNTTGIAELQGAVFDLAGGKPISPTYLAAIEALPNE